MVNHIEFFKSESHMVAHALIVLDGEARMNVLGINRRHYSSRENALKWYHTIEDRLVSTELPQEMLSCAVEELNDIYNRMIK